MDTAMHALIRRPEFCRAIVAPWFRNACYLRLRIIRRLPPIRAVYNVHASHQLHEISLIF